MTDHRLSPGTPASPLSPLFDLTAHVTEEVCRLPAVPVRTWCDLAARSFLPFAPRSAVAVVVGTSPGHGRVASVAGLGIGLSAPSPSSAPASRTRVGPAQESLIEQMRCGVTTINHLGWAWDSGGVETQIWGAFGGSDWRPDGVAEVFAPVRPRSCLAGAAPLTGRAEHRFVAVYIGVLDDLTIDPALAPVLRTCVLLLARKASLALRGAWERAESWLSDREQVVLDRLVAGKNVPRIAAELGRSAHTIQDNVKSLHRKLATTTRGELLARALGLAPPVPDPSSGSAAD